MRTLVGTCVVWAALAAGPAAAAECAAPQLEAALGALTAGLDARPRAVLARIDGLGRRLLATRSYLRAGSELPARWSWTAQEIAAYELSGEYRALLREIAKVRRRFEELNPGYTLYVNLTARSVDLQLQRWNSNASVTRAAAQILDAALEHDCDGLQRFLVDWRPPVLPTLAAPGLSRHGQLRAFDFQVKQGDRIVA